MVGCKKHVFYDHDQWRRDVDQMLLLDEAQQEKQTVHTNPNWLADLTRDFKQNIIAKCSQRVKEAVDANENIQVCYKITAS